MKSHCRLPAWSFLYSKFLFQLESLGRYRNKCSNVSHPLDEPLNKRNKKKYAKIKAAYISGHCDQQVEEGNSPLLLRSGEIPPGALYPPLGISVLEGHGPAGAKLEGTRKVLRGPEHLCYGDRLRELVSSAWRMEGSTEILEHLPVPKGATIELERDFGPWHGVTGQGGMASH